MTTRIRYSDAIAETLRMEMHRDPSIVLIDGDEGGGMATEFGQDRSIELAPSNEERIGIAAGVATGGRRPVVTVPMDALGPALVADLAAALGATAGSPLPLVVRIPCGPEGVAASKRRAIESLLAIEGLAVVAPATPADAKGLLSSALHERGPVCILEHSALWRNVDDVPEGSHLVPLGSARITATGSRMTIVSAGPAAVMAERAAGLREGEVTALDLRCLRPLDEDTILECARGTGKLLVLEEADLPLGADTVTSVIVAGAFEHLDGPIRRLRVERVGTPEDDFEDSDLPSVEAACDELLAY